MKSRKIHRTYLSIVEGCTESFGTIDAPIGRADKSIITRMIDYEHGSPARTHYKKLADLEPSEKWMEKFPGFPPDGISLIQLQLETGRTHQIRVHMTSIGHPLCGDTLYNPSTRLMNRQALHSYSLQFEHPVTGENMYFTAPLPEDMKQFFPSIN